MHFDQINRFEMNCIFKNLLRIDHFVRRWFQSSQDCKPIEYFWMIFLGHDLFGTILQQLKLNHLHLVLTCSHSNDLFDLNWNQLWNRYPPWREKFWNVQMPQALKVTNLWPIFCSVDDKAALVSMISKSIPCSRLPLSSSFLSNSSLSNAFKIGNQG